MENIDKLNLSHGCILSSEFKYNVLLVDDDSMCTFIHERIIGMSKRFGMVHKASNGQQALDLLAALSREEAPHLILIDLDMPVMDGFRFIEKLRETCFEHCHDATLAILSSSSHKRDRDRAQSLGVEEFLVKPLTPENLGGVVAKIQAKQQQISIHI